MDSAILKTFFTLAISVGVLGLVLFYLKKYTNKVKGVKDLKKMAIQGKISLSPKSHVFIINVDGKELLIGATEQNVSLLCDLNQESNVNLNSNSNKFASKEELFDTNNFEKQNLKNSKIQKLDQKENIEIAEDLTFKSFLKSSFKKAV